MMNSREKIVQKRFLKKEEEIIKNLGRLYRRSNQAVKQQIAKDYDAIKKLNEQIKQLDPDDPQVAILKSKRQSKVYSKQYQESLKGQIDTILNDMNDKQYTTVSSYLNGCYDDGYIGAMYNLHAQGIPLSLPIDQQRAVHAVQLQSKISEGLYSKMVNSTAMLKMQIRDEVTRSMINGTSYVDCARKLDERANIGMNNAIRIARTEGHRIQVTAAMDAAIDAKDEGANVVKQWDSSLDGKVRPSHRRVDGEIREIEEPFSNGLMFPGDPRGSAGEVINCRCALLQRALWALDEDELEELKQRAEYFGLDKSDSFEEFRKKYIDIAKDPNVIKIQELEKEKSELERLIASKYDTSKKYTDRLKKVSGEFTLDDYEKYKDDIERSIWRAEDMDTVDADGLAKRFQILMKSGNWDEGDVLEALRRELDLSKVTLNDVYRLNRKSIWEHFEDDTLYDYLKGSMDRYNDYIETFYKATERELKEYVRLAEAYARDKSKVDAIVSKIKKIEREMLSNGALTNTSFIARTQSASILNTLQDYAEKRGAYSKTLSMIASNIGKSVDEARELLSESLKQVIDECDVGMRIRYQNLKLVLKENDGGFKNLFEVGRSGGCSNTYARYGGQKSVFGFTKDHDDLTRIDKENMPVYGMMVPKLDVLADNYDECVEYITDGPGDWYGNGFTVVLKKEKIFNNASFTIGDSLDYKHFVTGSTFDNPIFNGANYNFVDEAEKFLDAKDGNSKLLAGFNRGGDTYLEVQIHGKENHAYEYIDKVLISDKYSYNQAKNDGLIDMLDDRGIPYEILRK